MEKIFTKEFFEALKLEPLSFYKQSENFLNESNLNDNFLADIYNLCKKYTKESEQENIMALHEKSGKFGK